LNTGEPTALVSKYRLVPIWEFVEEVVDPGYLTDALHLFRGGLSVLDGDVVP